jgi:hypothetical protein
MTTKKKKKAAVPSTYERPTVFNPSVAKPRPVPPTRVRSPK